MRKFSDLQERNSSSQHDAGDEAGCHDDVDQDTVDDDDELMTRVDELLTSDGEDSVHHSHQDGGEHAHFISFTRVPQCRSGRLIDLRST